MGHDDTSLSEEEWNFLPLLMDISQKIGSGRFLSDMSVDADTRDEYVRLLSFSLIGFGIVIPSLYFVQRFCGNRLRRRQMLAGQVDSDQNDDVSVDSSVDDEQNDQNGIGHHLEVLDQWGCHCKVRILQLQLLRPTRMILKQEHFVVDPQKNSGTIDVELGNVIDASIHVDGTLERSKREKGHHEQSKMEFMDDISMSKDSKGERTVPLDDDDEESRLIRIPKPGLTWKTNNPVDGVPSCVDALKSTRVVPGFCSICLSGFYPDHEIVWSSNAECEHVFHRECMEQWLIKLPCIEGPICPCCRRDFVVDPYNLCFCSRCK